MGKLYDDIPTDYGRLDLWDSIGSASSYPPLRRSAPMEQKELRLYDNTMLSDFKRCPRYFFYRHELGWTPEKKSAALIFGSSWHSAMEVVWAKFASIETRKLSRADIAMEAHQAFIQTWTQEGMPHPRDIDYAIEQELSPRTPGRALEMLLAYIEQRSKILHEIEVLSVEKAFAVPLDPRDDTIFYMGKIDKIILRHGKHIGIEHKTSSSYAKSGIFRGGFVDSFSPNSQVDGYLYAMHLLFPGKVGGIWVDAALVHKEVEGFLFIPVERRLEHLDSWLWEVRWWVQLVEGERIRLRMEGMSEANAFQAFPKNTNSCWDFHMACPYLEMCKSWSNPLNKKLPLGYKEERWSPLAHIKGLQDPRSVKLADLQTLTEKSPC